MNFKLPFKRILSFNDSTRNWEAAKKKFDELDDTDSGYDTRLDAVEAVESITAFTYATGWSAFGAPYTSTGYYKDRNRVYLVGAVKNSGAGTGLITTLPVGYRPVGQAVFTDAIFGAGTFGSITVAASGTVTDNTFSVASKTLTDLSMVSFRV